MRPQRRQDEDEDCCNTGRGMPRAPHGVGRVSAGLEPTRALDVHRQQRAHCPPRQLLQRNSTYHQAPLELMRRSEHKSEVCERDPRRLHHHRSAPARAQQPAAPPAQADQAWCPAHHWRSQAQHLELEDQNAEATLPLPSIGASALTVTPFHDRVPRDTMPELAHATRPGSVWVRCG